MFAAGRFARIHTQEGREIANARRVEADTTHLVQLRYETKLSSITEKMYVLWGARTLNIIRITQDNDRTRDISLYCKEAG